MGGNAFDKAERLDPHEYKDLCEDIVWLLSNTHRHQVDFAIPLSVRDKESYGDVDILVAGDCIEATLAQFKKGFLVVGEIKNTSGYNLLVHFRGTLVQVDLNKVSPFDFDFAYHYFSWNDLGNLIGRIAHRQGIKFGHDGLWYIHKVGDQQLGEILLTGDFETAIKYLGFDVDEYNRGFDSFEQMFNWIKACKHFDPHGYPLEHRSHVARTRDRKRKTYMAFLQWLNFSDEYVPSDKAAWLVKHKENFKHLGTKIDELDREQDLNAEYKAKVNGNLVRELTGVDGKELGKLMAIVKRIIPRELALVCSAETIPMLISSAYRLYKEGQ